MSRIDVSDVFRQDGKYSLVLFRDSGNMSTLVIYSGGSNTTAVAKYVAEKINGKAVTVKEASEIDIGAYDKIVVGTRVRAGKVPSDLREYVAKNKGALDKKSPSFYLCCLYNDDKGQKQLEKIASELGFSKYIYINKAKKTIATPGNLVDDFINSL